MKLKLKQIIYSSVKLTSFWQNNYLILRQLKYFKLIAFTAIAFTLIGACFDGITVSLIASFLPGLTNLNEPLIQIGIDWFDTTILATKTTASVRVYRLAAVILLVIWLRSLLHYGSQLYTRLAQCHLSDRIRKLIFEQLQSLNLSYYSKIHSGEPINSMTREVNELKLVFNLTANIMAQGSTLITYIISIFWLSWQLSLLLTFMFVLFRLIPLISQINHSRLLAKKGELWKYHQMQFESVTGVA